MDTRCKLLHAAASLVAEQGPDALTLDAVARRAEVSKGGLLYHFSSKDALIRGLGDLLLEYYETRVREEEAADSGGPGTFTRAYLRATTHCGAKGADSCTEFAGVATAIAKSPELLSRFAARRVEWRARFEDDGIDPVSAAIVRFAAEGVKMAFLFDWDPPGPELRQQIVARLEELTRGKQVTNGDQAPPLGSGNPAPCEERGVREGRG